MKESREIARRRGLEPVELDKVPEQVIAANTGRYPDYRNAHGSTGFQLVDYWRAIRKRLWLVAGVAVIVTILAAVYMARKPNIYQAKAIIQVDLEQINPDLVTNDRQRPMSNPDPSYINTQLQLLGSDALLRRVIKDHSLDTNKEMQAGLQGGSAFQGLLRSLGLSGSAPKSEPDYTKIAEGPGAEDIAEAIRLKPFVEQIKPNLNIEPVREARASFKDTRLIELTFRHTNPGFAADVVNYIGDTFVNANSEKRSGTSRKTNDFLQQRIAELEGEVKTTELQLVAERQNAGILRTEGDQTIAIDRLSGLNRGLLEAENDRKLKEAKYNSVLRSSQNAEAMTEDLVRRYTTEQENSRRTNQDAAQRKIADLNAQKAKLLEEYKETAPEVREVTTQINSLETSIRTDNDRYNKDLTAFKTRSVQVLIDTLRTEYQQAKEREDKVRSDYNQQYNLAQGQDTGAVKIKLLEQNLATIKGFLDNLRKQQSGNDLAAQGTDNNISVADRALPDDAPVSPRRVTTVLVALFLSTLFGMGLALLLEYLDDTISSAEEVETFLQLPALAAIPTLDISSKRRLLLVGANNQEMTEERAKSELLIYADSRSALAEAYRQLRTSILLSTAGHAPKSLLVTSSLPSEGKTTTATNTAVSLSQTGAKVLIIDADMRRPRIHSVFGMENADGLSSVLASEMIEADVLRAIKVDPKTGVSVLSSGPIPPNPAELIGSFQMSNLLTLLEKHFDHIVVDSPPIMSFTDGVLIASLVDGVILVLNANNTSRQIVRKARQYIEDIGAKIFGVVLNNVSQDGRNNNYYYQSYYYRNDDE